MNKYEVNTLEDLYDILDNFTDGVKWEEFYKKREKKPPFVVNSKIPDKVLVDFLKNNQIENAIVFGCGEGRNSIFLAKNNVNVDAIDLSEEAINNAIGTAKEQRVNVNFESGNLFKKEYLENHYDLVVDSGVFHHLAPHRRLQYREIIKKILKENGYFIMLCFADGDNVADEIDDLEFYNSRRVGVAFSKERIIRFFEGDFEIVKIYKGENQITEDYMEIAFLYNCIMKKR